MAIHRIPILGFATCPDATGECFLEPYDILATNDAWKYFVARFGASNAAEPTVKHGLYGAFMVPKNYVSGPKVIVEWTATVTTGNVRWNFEYRTVGGDDTTSLDQSGTEESVAITDAAPGAANRKLEPPGGLALTAANLSVDEIVQFYFTRDGANAADTMAASALLHALMLEYSDT